MARVPADATAFGDRSMPYMLSIDSVWSEAMDDVTNIAWTRDFWKRMQPYAQQGRMYLNFPGLGEEGERLLRDTFGDNYASPAGDQAEIRSRQYLPLQSQCSAGRLAKGGLARPPSRRNQVVSLRRMAALGQTRKGQLVHVVSAFPLEAEIPSASG